jgi:hypothetical protein
VTLRAGPVSPRRRRANSKHTLLCALLWIGTLTPIFIALGTDSEVPGETRVLGACLWLLCMLPANLYLRAQPSRRRPLPFIQAISAIYGLYYAFPVALGEANRAWRITVDPRDGYDAPTQLALIGWVAMMLAYLVTTHFFRRRKPPTEIPWNPKIMEKWGIAFLVGGVVVNALGSIIGGIPAIGGFLQLFVSLQWLGLGLLTVLARRKELDSIGRVVLVLGLFAAIGVALAQGAISPVVLICAVIAFALWTGRPQIEARWIIAGAFAMLLAISLRGVIRDFRMTAWYGNLDLSQTEKAELMIRLLSTRIANEGIGGTIGGGVAQTAQRSANMDLFADVVRRTPSEIPYWNGQTYLSLVGAAVPRFLWPDKPTKELGQAFGHRYRYLDPSNRSTAINLPITVEFYANFGSAAVFFGMLIVGAIYGALDSFVNKPGQSLLVSMIGLTLLLPLLIIESDFSLVFGGLPLSGLALWGIWVMIKRSALGKQRHGRASARVTRVSPGGQLRTGPDRPALPTG